MSRTKAFRNGYSDPHGIIYSTDDLGTHIQATAMSPDGEAYSTAHFNFDPDTGAHEVVPGTLHLHPDHAALGVGRQMRRLVNANF
jgi:hypothetical protein